MDEKNELLSREQLGLLTDAHCHPTDSLDTIGQLSNLRTGKLCLMSTRFNDQDYVKTVSQKFKDKVHPFHGYHPWFSHLLYKDDTVQAHRESGAGVDFKTFHYRKVLSSEPDPSFIDGLPEPQSLQSKCEELEGRLQAEPEANVGEIGLDKTFRVPEGPYDPSSSLPKSALTPCHVSLDHQIAVIEAQIRLARKYRRCVSIHGVQAHGKLYSAVEKVLSDSKAQKISKTRLKREMAERRRMGEDGSDEEKDTGALERSTINICLHSYSGSSENIKRWVKTDLPIHVYFSFSNCINSRYDRFGEVIKSVPRDNILVESDFHNCIYIDQELSRVVRFICDVKGWSISEGVDTLAANSRRFLSQGS